MIVRRIAPAVALLALAATAIAGCGSGSGGETTATPAAAAHSATHSPATAAAPITVRDAWVKAADSGMTGAFGVLVNTTGSPVTVVSASSPAAAEVELHEVVTEGGTSQMRVKQGGFVIPANGTHELRPGADHIMLMELTGPIEPGTDVTITLTLQDGTTVDFTAVAKEYAGAKESYAPDEHLHE